MDPRVEQANAELVIGLQQLLEMMEQAGGAKDAEARMALSRFTTQLEKLEAAKVGASSSGTDSNDSVKPVVKEAVAVETQMHALQIRLGSLERRLGAIAPETQELLAGAAGGLLNDLHRGYTVDGAEAVDAELGSVDDREREEDSVLPGNAGTAEAAVTMAAVTDKSKQQQENPIDR